MKKSYFVILFAVFLFFCNNLMAQRSQPIVVGISPNKPMAFIDEKGNVKGFSVDLWREVAKDIGILYKIQRFDLFGQKLQAVYDGKIDVGIGGITMTTEREKRIDFAHSELETGLQILVKKPEDASYAYALLKKITGKEMRTVLVIFILFIMAGGLILWIGDKDNNSSNDEGGIEDKFVPGYFQACWVIFMMATTIGFGDMAPKKWRSRVVSAFITVFGMAFYGTILGLVASISITNANLENLKIKSHYDLVNRTIVVKGVHTANGASTYAAQYMVDFGAKVVLKPTMEECYDALLNDEVEAVVYDAPALLYYAKNEGNDKVMVVGSLFERQHQGFAFPDKSNLLEPVNQSLLKLKADGTYWKIYEKWFGSTQ